VERLRQLSDHPAPLPAESEERGVGNLLVERWQQGVDREETFRQLYLLYVRKVYQFFVRRGFLRDECMDLTQETFLRVHNHLGSFRHDSRFETWLFKIATNLYRNRLRTLATLKRHAQEVPFDATAEGELTAARPESIVTGTDERGPLCEVLSGERLKLLREAMDDLPAQMRRCVLLRVEGDFKYREIADLMQVSVDTVKTHLFQARQQLKGRLADYFTDLEV
jgi:RNA polymerase sigma-70 factor, ECF subfamily